MVFIQYHPPHPPSTTIGSLLSKACVNPLQKKSTPVQASAPVVINVVNYSGQWALIGWLHWNVSSSPCVRYNIRHFRVRPGMNLDTSRTGDYYSSQGIDRKHSVPRRLQTEPPIWRFTGKTAVNKHEQLLNLKTTGRHYFFCTLRKPLVFCKTFFYYMAINWYRITIMWTFSTKWNTAGTQSDFPPLQLKMAALWASTVRCSHSNGDS